VCGQGGRNKQHSHHTNIYIYIYIYIYAYGAQCFLEGNKMKCSKSATTLQDSASDTDGKQTPDIYL
jgi:hypothetical protein